MKRFGRRFVLKGAGGLVFGLPMLEGLRPRGVRAAEGGVPPFAIFFRQANGCACAQDTDLGAEPERFWPTTEGPITADTVNGRALDELLEHADRLLVVGNVNNNYFDYGDGHANGALQGLTASGPVVPNVGGDSEANGESLDNRIGRELNPDGRDSLFLYAGANYGWLGGACISYRGPNQRHAPIGDPMTAYAGMMGVDAALFEQLAARQKSVNDLVRGQMQDLLARPELSSGDRQRLQLHMDSIRDLENSLSCNFNDTDLSEVQGNSAAFDTEIGDEVLAAAKAHMHIAALAVACGYTRSVAIQIGAGNDGNTRYTNLDTGELMENYHYISHRRLSHDNSGAIIPNSDLLHHFVDRHFARTFKYLLDRLYEYELPTGDRLIDCGVACWYNDNGNGPGHSPQNIPWVIAGGAAGFLKQGQYIRVAAGDQSPNCSKLLNTIGSAAGLRNAEGGNLDNFGDPSMPQGVFDELLA